MQGDCAWGNVGKNGHNNDRYPWVARTTRKNYKCLGYYPYLAGRNPLCIFNPIKITQWVSAACCLLATLCCLLLTVGDHTHCSHGYSSASSSRSGCASVLNWNAIFWSRTTVWDIPCLIQGSLSWSPHCNGGLIHITSITKPSVSTPSFTVSTIYSLGKLQSVELGKLKQWTPPF